MHSDGELGLFRLWKRVIEAEMRALPLLSAWRLQLLTKSSVACVGSVRVTNICDATRSPPHEAT